jgi:hypothetical protein
MLLRSPFFPTDLHRLSAEIAAGFFAPHAEIDTVLVTNSCARGNAVPESDLDMQILVREGVDAATMQALEAQWRAFAGSSTVIRAFKEASRFAYVHLDVTDAFYEAQPWDDGGGPDDFEIGVGNIIAHSAPLGEIGPHFAHLRSVWLPYYDDVLRVQRLAMARDAALYDLDFIPFYVKRRLYFQAFDRLYKAHREFLQALFIAHSTYPIAYNKWIHEQVADWLHLPDLYAELPTILSISKLDSDEIIGKAARLAELIEAFTS